jgi:adenylate cyclase
MKSGEDVGLGGEVADLTLFFSAISGFSNLSEQLPVEEVTEILNKHLEALSNIIKREKGTIDKYMGDSIMAFWGAPLARADGPERACRAALLCQRADRELDQELADAGKPTADNVFAVHCGDAIVGNIGSSARMNYTAMGVSVETARMLRYQNYHYGTSILISDATYQHVEGLFSCRRLDVVRLRNDLEPLTLFELLGERDAPLAPVLIDYNMRYESAFSQYQQGDWEEALASFRDLSLERPEDKAARLLVSRLQKIRPVRGKGRRPPKDWNGSAPASW